jgi:outer membrane protein OmpA-like peptidoglycan-associated protein
MKKIAAYTCTLIVASLATPAIAQEQEAEASGSFSLSGEGASSEGSASGDGWMDQYTPEAGLIELGAFFGLWWVSRHHNLRDPGNDHFKLNRPALDLGLRGAYFPLSFLGAELEGALGPSARTEDDSATLWGLRAHVIGQLPGMRITPFALLGAGRMGVWSDRLGDDGDPAVHVGLGAKLALSKLLSVRLDLRDNMTGKNPDARESRGEIAHHPEILLGLSLTLGRSDRVAAASVAPSDRDGDGFFDSDDKCPDDPGIAPDGCPDLDADKDGILLPHDKCPTEKGVAPDGCPVGDRDGDGILDPDDRCPDEPGIPPDGCPDPDPDKDGILNPHDKCPNEPETFNGYQDEDGCPDELPEEVKKFTGVIQGIQFDVNKATIRPTSFATLDAAAQVLNDYSELKLEISGHTDTDGKQARNLKLSQDRADSVKAYLVKKGVAEDRIQTRGAGPDEPIADNKTREGKQQNRRIEFKLL